MSDTHPDAAERYARALMSKSPAERLRMACSMFDAARILAEAHIRSRQPDITPRGLKRQLFLRFYGSDFTDDEKRRILESIS